MANSESDEMLIMEKKLSNEAFNASSLLLPSFVGVSLFFNPYQKISSGFNALLSSNF